MSKKHRLIVIRKYRENLQFNLIFEKKVKCNFKRKKMFKLCYILLKRIKKLFQRNLFHKNNLIHSFNIFYINLNIVSKKIYLKNYH